MGRIASFPIYVTNALPSNWAVAFHKTAFVLGMRAPAIPRGATFGSSQSAFGLAMRWLRDYDFRNVQDRSLVDTYLGTSSVSDGANEAQTVTEGGSGLTSFTLTYAGQTTASIAAAATALTVQQRLEALSNIEVGGVTVTGAAGGPYTVTFNNQTDVAQMTSTPTGGTGTVTVATATAGASAVMVRAVKITL
jgi:hypothetical protein